MKKDEIVVPGYYAYLLRVDYLDFSQEHVISLLEKFFDLENIEAYYCFEEVSKVVKKLHIQAIIWSNKIYTPSMCQKIKRDYFKDIYSQSSSSIAFTDAKKPQNLASYSAKDNELILSTLTPEEITRIPIWKNIKSYRDKEFKDNLKKWFKDNSSLPLQKFMVELTKFHWTNERSQPARHLMIKYLGIYHKDYSAQDYVNSLNIIPLHLQHDGGPYYNNL